MKKAIAITLLLSTIFLSLGVLAANKDELNIPVKKLYSTPVDGSKVIYEIPIKVKLLDISEDGNWYKVKLSYYIGPFNYTHVGWAYIPVAEILAEREKEASDIAHLAKEN